MHRVWSAAWAADPDGENARLVDAYAKAVTDADAYDWAVAAAEADVVAGMPEDRPASADESGARDGMARRKPGRGSKRNANTPRGNDSRTGAAARDGGAADSESGGDGGQSADGGENDRGTKPVLVRRRPIGEHTGRELAALARWVESGAAGRTEADVAAELATELDVLHPGPRADDVLVHAVRVARAGAPELS